MIFWPYFHLCAHKVISCLQSVWFMSHPTQKRSFGRRSSRPIDWLSTEPAFNQTSDIILEFSNQCNYFAIVSNTFPLVLAFFHITVQ